MERLPQVQEFCTKALRLVCARVEELVASESDLASISSVITPAHLQEVVEERFAQCRCGSLKCGNIVMKQALSSLRFNETSGEFEESLGHFCSQKCSDDCEELKASLDPTPTFLRSLPVEKVLKAARAIRVSASCLKELEALAKPLMPKPIVVVEEQENTHATAPPNVAQDGLPSIMMNDDHDIRDLLDWDDVDKGDPEAMKVHVPLVPVIWDLMSQWVTGDTRDFVRHGRLPQETCVDRTVDGNVADLTGRSLVQRQVRLSQALGPKIRSLLLECDVDDPEDHQLLLASVDNLISTLYVTQERTVVAEGAKFDYSMPGSLFFSSKGLSIVAAVLVCVFRPKLTEKVLKQAKGVQRYELEMLKDLF